MPSSTPKLSEAARHVVVPSGIKTTMWPAVEKWWADRGTLFDPWQRGLGMVCLGKRANGKLACTVGGTVMSIPRQVGKTFLVGSIVIALCCMYPNMLWVWTAHRSRTSDMTFDSLKSLVGRKGVARYVAPGGVRIASGEKEIRFANGSRIVFGAREQGFGRGFERVDGQVFDEAQILTEKALEDMIPASNQAKHPFGALLFFMGTPPRPHDPGEVFTLKRQRALEGKSQDSVYIEFSADQDADPDDWGQVAKANPSFPQRTSRESIRRMRENLPSDDSFLREGLGVWQESVSSGVIPMDAWTDRLDEASRAVDRLVLGVEVGPDMGCASVGLAGVRADEAWHVELLESRRGAAWLIGWIVDKVEKNPGLEVAGDVYGPLKALVYKRNGRYFLNGTTVRVHAPSTAEVGVACSRVLAGVLDGSVRHIGQHQLDSAVKVAGKRPIGDTGMWAYSRKTAVSDITPVQAVTWALWRSQEEFDSAPVTPIRRKRRVGIG